MISDKKIPINRVNRYYDEIDFQMELDMAREVIEDDMNFKIVLYRINMAETDTDDLYGETKSGGARYYPPVELAVMVDLAEAVNKSYNPNGTIRYQDYGPLTFYILQDQLTEMNVEISYGDVVAYADSETNLKYFKVTDDGKIISDNKHTIYGYKGYYRTIKAVTIDPNEFNNM